MIIILYGILILEWYVRLYYKYLPENIRCHILLIAWLCLASIPDTRCVCVCRTCTYAQHEASAEGSQQFHVTPFTWDECIFIWRPHLNVYSRLTSRRVSTRPELSSAFNFKARAHSGSGIGRGPRGYAGCVSPLFPMPYVNEKEDILHNGKKLLKSFSSKTKKNLCKDTIRFICFKCILH